MPRKGRVAPGGWVYHAVNRGNRGMRIFGSEGDYLAFLHAMDDALKVVPMRILGWCLMPNHWHLVLWPKEDGDLSRFVGWVSNTHVRRYNRFHGLDGRGHLYQGRFKSFPVQEDYHLLCVLRYVEANALRAGLAEHAEAWPWGSLHARLAAAGGSASRPPLSEWPVRCPENWADLVNEMLQREQVERVRQSIERSRPCGEGKWLDRTAASLGLLHTLRPPGRPRKEQKQAIS
jgi:putative transposase